MPAIHTVIATSLSLVHKKLGSEDGQSFFYAGLLPRNTDVVGLVQQVSPFAWQHINFYGRYEFIQGPEPVNMDAIVE